MTVARHLVVHGHVQGVFFRASLRREAAARGVAGWAANRADGTVEAWLEGEPVAIDTVARWCEHGPRGADVTHVERHAEEPQGLSGFEIR